jgi:fibronectin-binding autotransporter adhesin
MSTTTTWTGNDGDWNNGADWTGAAVPDASTIAAVITQGTVTVDSGDSFAVDSLTLSNAGTELELGGTLDFTGAVDDAIDIDAGTLALDQAGTLRGAPDVTIGTDGTLDLSAATQPVETIDGLDDEGTIILGNTAVIIGAGGADSSLSGTIETGADPEGGLIEKTGSGSLTLDNAVMNPGTNNSGLYIAAGSLLETADSSSVFYLAVGEGAGSTASATLSGGTLSIGSALQVGDYGGNGTFDQTGGVLDLDGSLNIGNEGGTGTYAISDGILSLNDGLFDLGRNDGTHAASTGILSISSDGLVDVAAGGELILGDRVSGTAGNGSGTIVQTGGTLAIEPGAALYLSAYGNGEYDLDGGTLEVGGTGLNNNYNAHGGTSVFNLAGGTIAVTGSALTTNVNATLAAGSTSALDVGALGASFTGSLSGSGNLDILGTGTASFASLDTTGTVTLEGNTLDLSKGSVAEIGAIAGTGTVILGNAALIIGAGDADSSFSGTIETGTTQAGGLIEKTGSGGLTLDNAVMNPGTNNSGLYIAAGSLLEDTGSSSLFYAAIGEGAGSIASATLSGDGTMTIGNGNPNGGGALQVGDYGGTGSFDQTGGVLDLDGSLNIGNQGGTGTYAISGGTLALEGGMYVVGRNSGTHAASTGNLSISGSGLVDVAAGEMILGDNVSSTGGEGSGTIVQSGGTLAIEPGSALYLSAYGNGEYDLDGGTLEVGGTGLNGNYNAHGGTSVFNLDGGTIEVTGSALTTNVNATLAAGSTSALDVGALGASFTGTIAGSGNLDILGTGTVSFADLDTTGTVTLNGATLELGGGAEIGAIAGTGILGAGSTITGTTVQSGSTMVVSGTAIDTTVTNGGTQVVTNGGTVIGAVVEQNSTQIISSGGVAIGTTVGDPSVQTIASGGTAFDTTLTAGGELDVYGSVSATTVETGGAEVLYSGGTATGSVIESGGTLVFDGGTASGTTLEAGATLEVGTQSYTAGTTGTLTTFDSFTTALDSGTTLTLNDVNFGASSVLEVNQNASGSETVISNNDFSNAGLISETSAADLDLELTQAGGTFTNTGTIYAASNGSYNAILDIDNTDNYPADSIGSFVNDGLITVSGDGAMVEVWGTNAIGGTGTIDISNGGNLVLEDTAATTSNQTINLKDGSGDWVIIADPDSLLAGSTFADTINVAAGADNGGDELIFANLDQSGISSVTYDANTKLLDVNYLSGKDVDFTITGLNASDVFKASAFNPAGFPLAVDAAAPNGYEAIDLGCFTAGTQLLTPDGYMAVEDITAGTLLVTNEGQALPVRWLGRSTVSTRFADGLRVLPIRIKAGALGDDLPCRDLLVSPDHAMFVGGVLIQAGALVNGTSIIREAGVPEIFTYYHVELATHELLIAEGAPAESFVDNIDRMSFDNWAERGSVQTAAPIAEMSYPRAKSHRQVPRTVRTMLAARAVQFTGANDANAA